MTNKTTQELITIARVPVEVTGESRSDRAQQEAANAELERRYSSSAALYAIVTGELPARYAE